MNKNEWKEKIRRTLSIFCSKNIANLGGLQYVAWEDEDVQPFLDLMCDFAEEIIGEDEERNPDYSILNPFRRMEEDVREHINQVKRKQRQRIAEWREKNI